MEIHFALIISFILALVISLYTIPSIVSIVKKINLLDHPNERSSAHKSIPTLGGISIFISFILASTIGLFGIDMPEIRYILSALLIIFFLGLTDDIVGIPPLKKIIYQTAAACFIIFLAKIRFTNLHGILGIWEIGPVTGSILTLFTIIVIINAFNLIDGIDGLAAGVTMLIALVFGSWFYLSSNYNYAILAASLVGSVLGFFYFNVYGVESKIFMGDTGSLVIGTVISILVIKFNETNIDHSQAFSIHAAPAVSIGILSYPLMDLIRVVVIRIFNSRHPFTADKNHFHHRLLTLGLSHKLASFSIIGFNILFIIAVFCLNNLGYVRIILYISIACAILVMVPAYFIHKGKLIREDDPVQQLLVPHSSNEVSRVKKRRINKQKKSQNDSLAT